MSSYYIPLSEIHIYVRCDILRKHDSFLVIRYARRAWDFLQDSSVISVAFSDSSDVDDLASIFVDAFIRMQKRGFNFTPQSLEPLELALLLTRMSTGTSLWPCSVGPVALRDIGKVGLFLYSHPRQCC